MARYHLYENPPSFIPNRTGSALMNRQVGNTIPDFVRFALPHNYNIARAAGAPKPQALNVARWMTQQQGLESEYGRSNAAKNNNRSGSMSGGKTIKFDNVDSNNRNILNMFVNRFPNAFKQLTLEDYVNYLQNGTYRYEDSLPAGEYLNRIRGTKSLNKAIDEYYNSGITNNWTSLDGLNLYNRI